MTKILRLSLMPLCLAAIFTSVFSAAPKAAAKLSVKPAPRDVVSEWKGKTFFALEKNRLLAEYGYELYATAKLVKETAPADPALFTKDHRIKTAAIQGHKLTVTSAAKISGSIDVALVLSSDTLGLTLYGRTKNGSLEGLAAYDDLAFAKNRWLGKKVWSRRRLIDIYDSTASKFSEKVVSILEPLDVISVRFGTTPLPPNPVWLIVKAADGTQGLIPIRSSWINAVASDLRSGNPWDDDIFEADPRSLYKWDQYTWEVIDKHNVFVGMTEDQVKMSRGEPLKVTAEKVKGSATPRIVYQYETDIYRFESGVLVAQ